MTQQQKTIQLLPLCHILVMLAVASWWGIYFWRHTPSRELFHLHDPTLKQVAQAARHTALVPKLDFLHSSQGRCVFSPAEGKGLPAQPPVLPAVNDVSMLPLKPRGLSDR